MKLPTLIPTANALSCILLEDFDHVDFISKADVVFEGHIVSTENSNGILKHMRLK
jgi:hypothetical protein